MTNVKVIMWKHGANKSKIAPTFRTILGRDSLKNKRKRKQKKQTNGPDINLKYSWKRERKKFSLKSKIICYRFEEFNTTHRCCGKYCNLLIMANFGLDYFSYLAQPEIIFVKC